MRTLERLSDQCTDLFFVAERRLNLDRRFNAGVEYWRNPQSRSDG
jgi:hypothetical protein